MKREESTPGTIHSFERVDVLYVPSSVSMVFCRSSRLVSSRLVCVSVLFLLHYGTGYEFIITIPQTSYTP